MKKRRIKFNKKIRREVFAKGTVIKNKDPKQFRKDKFDVVISCSDYGNRKSKYGWNIHHVDHDCKNNEINNLIPVHFETHEKIHTKGMCAMSCKDSRNKKD